MAPPEYAESTRHGRYHAYLDEHNFKDNPRFGENVDRLSSWLEFLLHPETHAHDREAFVPVGRTGGGGPTGYEWQEVPEPVARGGLHPGAPREETEFRSVLHEYRYSDFLDPLVAVSTQQVETGANLLATATAAVSNIYWVGQMFTHELANFPSEWKGTASVEEKVAEIKGVLWKDLAASYLRAVDEILREATAGINHLNAQMAELATNFAKAVPKFEDSLPQLDEAPR